MADITLINLNMLYIRYGEQTDRELHVPLGPLYLTRALEDAGFTVDFRDYQLCEADDPFDMETFLEFAKAPAPVVGSHAWPIFCRSPCWLSRRCGTNIPTGPSCWAV